jgi:DNA-binding response OmpR family regulator
VDGWMRRLFAHELGESESQESAILDLKARQLVGPAGRQDLSPLEFGVMKLLIEREGDPVSREQLLAEVWNIHYDGSSNVVDTVIRALRKKLGERADSIESVRGVGYRYLAGQRAAED